MTIEITNDEWVRLAVLLNNEIKDNEEFIQKHEGNLAYEPLIRASKELIAQYQGIMDKMGAKKH